LKIEFPENAKKKEDELVQVLKVKAIIGTYV
jgi:hypothetical protein